MLQITPGSGVAGFAYGINNNDIVVGNHGKTDGYGNVISPSGAYYWSVGTGRVYLPAISGTTDPVAFAINNNTTSTIVGKSGSRAVAWQSGAVTDLGQGVARAVNSHNQIVGDDGNSSSPRATLFNIGSTTPIDLNSCVPGISNWTLESATGINDSGWIVGYGKRTISGVVRRRAFLLKPIP
ncbi:MAG: hypothetical protein OHK0029_18370 [Armatimonadaceae bacterium]